ncbi:hypothetical protein IEQ34_007958 [Dendrobium chrysotoxum]|uniref:F-box associated domain-containing protein n=1 Tax=Dendrobium chrysotoxum TaxID=161865 RepID=A0AAV7H2T6_DENCH|nr:hypothetical protein IEQ34_007958 [Dendrobium chrysotoxum]
MLDISIMAYQFLGYLWIFFVKMESQEDGCVLSEDNIYEIMTRVALLSLPSCLSVCRSWRRIGYLPCFGEAHSLRTTTTSGFILQKFDCDEYHHAFISMHSLHAHPLPISSLPPGRAQTLNIEAIAPTHSLLFCNIKPEYNCKNDINPRYYITRLGTTPCNIPIPNPKTRFNTCGVAIFCDAHNINQTTYDFKIVRISMQRWGQTPVPNLLYCEILDSKARKWRRSNDLPFLWPRDKTGIVIKQKAYWIVERIQNPSVNVSSCSVFEFNVEEEKGRIIKGPEVTFITPNQVYKWKMVPYQERLCLVYMSDEIINVWMMLVGTSNENIHQWEWKGSYSTHYIKNYKFTFEVDTPNQKVVLLETLYRELWYDLHERDMLDISIMAYQFLGYLWMYDLHKRDLVGYIYPRTSILRISMDGNF